MHTINIPVRQVPAFIATTLRRGLFLEEIGEVEKAVEDYNALHTLCKNFEEKEALAMTLNRLGHYELSYVFLLLNQRLHNPSRF